MRKSTMRIGLLISVCITFSFAQTSQWVSAYYAGWSQGSFNNGVLPADQIDYSAVTHIIHFALVPKSDGTLDDLSNSVQPSNAQALVSQAHAAGKKVIICVGGAGSSTAFLSATGLLTLSTFIDNLVNYMVQEGYDGIDIDWEPLELTDLLGYTTFITALRSRLDQITPRPLLTAATGGTQAPIFTLIADDFDQINLMTYDMSGAWPGWVPWHNAPLKDGGFRFPSTGGLVPSADNLINTFITGGVPANKLGIGIDFYGYVWSGGSGTSTGGVTQPRQSYSSAPSVQANIPYYTLMQKYYKPQYYEWDSSAQAAYMSIDNPGSANDKFISYDNEATCKAKLDYVKSKGIGGVIIWELGGGMLPKQFQNRDRLLHTVEMDMQNDSTAPPSPSLALPINAMVSAPVQPTFLWSDTGFASWHHLQVALDSTFSSIVIDEPWIIAPSFTTASLAPDQSYYWRVQSSNAFSQSAWSAVNQFHTEQDSAAPPGWQYAANTGSYATVLIPASVQPQGETSPLQPGDFIGVFFQHGGSLVCGGYTQWQPNSDIYITVWGDNPSTSAKEGFSPGDSLYFKLREESSDTEFTAAPTLVSGELTYSQNTTYVIASLNSSGIVSVPPSNVPATYSLDQNYPNPFNGSTAIKYTIPEEAMVVLEIFNELGQRIILLVNEAEPAGQYQAVFNSREFASGVYFYRIHAGNFVATKKMILDR